MTELHAKRFVPVAFLSTVLLVVVLGPSPIATPIAAAAPPVPPTSASTHPNDSSSAIDPQAVDMLHHSAERLRALKTFAVHADATRDRVVRDGFKVKTALSQDVVVREPSQMRADVSGDDGRRTIIYDGRYLSLLAEPENYYATVPAEPTIKATLDAVLARYAVDFPLADVIYIATGGDVGNHVTEAGVIGPSRVAGVDCDQLAFRTRAVDWQVWLDRSTLLPRKIVVTSREQRSAPLYEALLTWTTSPQIREDAFAFSPPADAQPMSLLKNDSTVDLVDTVRHAPNEDQKKGTTP